MTTPAQKAGIIENVTELRIKPNLTCERADVTRGDYANYVFVMYHDDGTYLPYFKSVCGRQNNRCFRLEWMEKVEAEQVPALPPMPVAPLPPQPPVVEAPKEVAIIALAELVLQPASKATARLVAIEAFSQMLADAEHGRETSEWRHPFRTSYGICDNIAGYVFKVVGESNPNRHTYHGWINEVKNNLIRRTASWSGEWHYPVPGVDGKNAEHCWDYSDNKWADAYGANRVVQLKELIALVQDDAVWAERLCDELTAADVLGFKIGSIYMHKHTNKLWKFERDDGSRNPYFRSVANGESDCIYLTELVAVGDTFGERSVPEFLADAAAKVAEISEIEQQIKALKGKLEIAQGSLVMLDMALAEQHKVRRL